MTKTNEASDVNQQHMNVCVPDIGGATDVDVIEILVTAGATVEKEQSLVTLEGDKATMDIPSPAAGTVEKIVMKVGDKVSQGTLILLLKPTTSASEVSSSEKPVQTASSQPPVLTSADNKEQPTEVVESQAEDNASPPSRELNTESQEPMGKPTNLVFAGPAVRRLARELGVALENVQGTGRKSRISKDDLVDYVKNKVNEKNTAGGFSVPVGPTIDFSQFGEINVQPLNKIKRLTGVNVHRSWIKIPHVTQFDEADITDLEQFRLSEADRAKAQGYKLTVLAFVCKVVCKALEVYPQFNASLEAGGERLIYKKYFNVGIAVETPNGLVVPVLKGVDRLSVADIAKEMARLSTKAREKGLMPNDMNGGCFTISSLGGIGGTAFTPIVNAPEVAILGLSRSKIQPVYSDEEESFKPRLMLPVSLSYDHRVIDGAEAARFARFICDGLADIRRILL